MRVVILDKVLNQIVNRGYEHIDYPATIQGMDVIQYEILVPIEPNVLPDFDSRYYIIQEQADIISVEPNNDGYRTITSIKTLVRKSDEEIIAALEEAETLANNQIVRLEKQVKTMIIALNSILRQQSGLTLTAKEQNAQTKISNYALKISQNDDILNNLKALVVQGNNPDIEAAGWITA